MSRLAQETGMLGKMKLLCMKGILSHKGKAPDQYFAGGLRNIKSLKCTFAT